MKEYSNCVDTKHLIFNNKLPAARNQIECAFGRLKGRWIFLNLAVDVDLEFAIRLIYVCFILYIFANLIRLIFNMMFCKRRWKD